jgi:uncharacterized protein
MPVTDTIHAFSVGTFMPVLRTLSTLLDKGAQHAAAAGLDPAALLDARLAPDMYPLAMQVRLACDHAKNGTARLIGLEPPPFAEVEPTLSELQARIARTIEYLGGVPEAAFAGAAEREIRMPLQAGLSLEMTGLQFLRDWALPHFYFHVVTAYDILRHHGVALGKRDFMAHIGYAIRRSD